MTHTSFAGPVLPFTPGADQTDKRGFFVKKGTAADEVILIATPASEIPLGVITDGSPTNGKSAVAVSGSGAIVKVKCAATPGSIILGSSLVLDGTTLGAVKLDPGTGARVQVARALEAGAANALIDAVLIAPAVLS